MAFNVSMVAFEPQYIDIVRGIWDRMIIYIVLIKCSRKSDYIHSIYSWHPADPLAST